MAYPQEVTDNSELEIIFRIRQLIGDEAEVFIDDRVIDGCAGVTMSGMTYQLEEPKGYPMSIYVDGNEYTSLAEVAVIGYKYIKFNSSILLEGQRVTVVYHHFRHSDLEIINTYDTGAFTYLTGQCNLTPEEIGIDLLVLATSYILLQKDLNNYIKAAVKLGDSDSEYDASQRPRYLKDLLSQIRGELQDSLKAKMNCKVISLPVYKIE